MHVPKDKDEGVARQAGWTDNRETVSYGAGGWSTTGAGWARAHWEVAAATGRSPATEGLDHARLLRCYTEGCPEAGQRDRSAVCKEA